MVLNSGSAAIVGIRKRKNSEIRNMDSDYSFRQLITHFKNKRNTLSM